MANCINCGGNFEIADEDLKFYEKISPVFGGEKFLVPSPKMCPDCRNQRRFSWRNERSLHKRKCSFSGKEIIAMYSENSVFPVYDNDIWWSDQWDARDFGRDFDFNRPFFEQFFELRDEVPHFALAVLKSTMENSDYCNQAGYLKNCYLLYNSDFSERCMYGKGVNRCFDCLDCFKIYDCEACYELSNCNNCQFCAYLWDSQNCSECLFGANLIGCKNCFGCINLQNKEYYFLNQKCTPEKYAQKVEEFLAKYSYDELILKFMEFKVKQPAKYMIERNTEDCTGCYLVNCKNSFECFDSEYLENCKYCFDLKKGDGVSFENYDVTAFGVGVTQCYECGTVGYNANKVLFSENVWESFEVLYSVLCMKNSKNLFGCVGLKKAQYCVLNKQYTKEEYENLVAKIIKHMQKTGEWGEFFPEKYSPFSYEESVAQEYFPQEISAKDPKEFKILDSEREFYQKMKLPLPRISPDERHKRRLSYRLPRKLWQRSCVECNIEIQTAYSPERPEKIYCRKCYLANLNS